MCVSEDETESVIDEAIEEINGLYIMYTTLPENLTPVRIYCAMVRGYPCHYR